MGACPYLLSGHRGALHSVKNPGFCFSSRLAPSALESFLPGSTRWHCGVPSHRHVGTPRMAIHGVSDSRWMWEENLSGCTIRWAPRRWLRRQLVFRPFLLNPLCFSCFRAPKKLLQLLGMSSFNNRRISVVRDRGSDAKSILYEKGNIGWIQASWKCVKHWADDSVVAFNPTFLHTMSMWSRISTVGNVSAFLTPNLHQNRPGHFLTPKAQHQSQNR